MRATLIVCAGIAALGTSLTERAREVEPRAAHAATNPCLHGREGYQQNVIETAESLAADEDADGDEPVAAERRAELGLAWWPIDSVHATTDSTVCSHIDSLIRVWQAGTEAQSKNATRDGAWPGISVARLNPHKYLATPPFHDGNGARWRFVVDSVSGSVRFYRGYTQ
ncbi:MAG: hypothetical protein MUD17_00210 [Gemmatimonadaceae bacterium]|jgi:hypothetical protein|nr:hypothetical protein [Gemmatimonadaceae bacterium]